MNDDHSLNNNWRRLVKNFVLSLILFMCFYNVYALGSSFEHYINKKRKSFSPETILLNSISPYNDYCDGYGNPGATGSGYINVIKLETGIARKGMDLMLDKILSFDKAETNNTYIGQIDAIIVSSFSGINGLIWGYDLAKSPILLKEKPLFTVKQINTTVPVYSIEPLLDAGLSLFGTRDNRVFPIMPGAMVRAAFKDYTAEGPTYIWSTIALSIAKDRTKNANLFMEDVGETHCSSMKECQAFMKKKMKKMALSSIRAGNNSRIHFSKIFLGYRLRYVPKGYVGTAIVASPYITLARNALPKTHPKSIVDMTIDEWSNMYQNNLTI